MFRPGLLELAAHIDEFNDRQRTTVDAVGHLDARVLALNRIVP